MMLGPNFALIDPRFGETRARASERRSPVNGQHNLLVYLGGGDTVSAWSKVIDALYRIDGARIGDARFLLGNSLNAIREKLATGPSLPFPVTLAGGTDAMHSELLWADLAIGAGGMNLFERACLHLPSLVVILAENQRRNALELAKQNLIWDAVEGSSNFTDAVGAFIKMTNEERRAAARRTASLCDGGGVRRILETINVME